MSSNMHEGKNKMLFHLDRKRKMSATALTSATRSALGLMVDKEARRVGSRTVAYEHVAQMIGASSSWVKKFLADTGEVSEPRITLFQNIKEAYANVCARIEQEQQNERDKIALLLGKLNEINSSADRMVDRKTKTK